MIKNKIFLAILIGLSIICLSSNVIAADSGGGLNGGTIKTKAESFLNDGQIQNTIDESSVVDFSNGFNSILMGLGIVIVVIAGVMLGIQFMVESSAGKAKIMEKLVPFLIGVVIIFGATYIWSQFIDIADKISG